VVRASTYLPGIMLTGAAVASGPGKRVQSSKRQIPFDFAITIKKKRFRSTYLVI